MKHKNLQQRNKRKQTQNIKKRQRMRTMNQASPTTKASETMNGVLLIIK